MLSADQIAQYHRDGFLVLRGMFAGRELDLLRAAADRVQAEAEARQGKAHCYQDIPGREGVDLLGPLPAPKPRRAGYQRDQLLLSARQRPALQRLLARAWAGLFDLPSARRVRWSLDVDPIDLY